ncbi:RIPOR family member 3 isoform X9 [Syngnathus scovelli]|uniref:RIPOR family member 3 isoform X9 n=1 Tax=Syngnathus scovelli TaxID=161590 RepID=UPI00210FF5F7|nr:RIPOR family member 3 isoform X9 [Syngnathus scovelli]
MSVKLRFDSPSDGKPIRRSRSFTGFGSLTGRRRPSSTRNSLRLNSVSERKTPRAPLSPRRGFGAVWSMQPEDVDHVFQALHKGLREHVQRHQTEMDFLSSRLQETKRNSRLGFQYDLDKEIRVHERLIRKLEFQKSKVDELYENYCVQWRLCQGAVNMKRAFSLAPSTRESRESLLELGRSHRHSEQAMSAMEEELEVLLGELHVKMKGLIGFARLCPRDQYEVVLQLGCQRWRIRGRIQSDDVQSWDEEEMLFLPHIKHNFEIKVSEAKGLGWQLVGAVTCASAHFFAATPQLMLVDITQLGTIKLQLEVTWNPLDSGEKVGLMSSGRPSGRSRKTSVQSWTAPSTPSFSEKHFLSMVQELQEGGGGASVPLRMIKSGRDRGVSLMSYLSHSSITSSLSQAKTPPRSSTPDILKDNQDNPAGSCEEAKDRQPDGGIGEFPASPVASAAAEPGGGEQRTQALQLGTLLGELERSLRPLRSCESQLRLLKQQIEHLNTILRNDLSLIRPSSWDDTLAMEEVLCSFDFLSHDDDSSCSGGMSCPRSPLPQNHRWGCEKEPPVVPLTCGHWGLDQVLETHLDTCCILLEMLQRINFSLTRVDLLEDVSQQVDVLNRIGCLLLEDKNGISTEDLLPEDQRSRDVLLLWAECVRDSDSSSPFCCHSDNFVNALRKQYSHKIKANAEAKQPGLSERVFRTLLQQVQAACRVALWPPQPPSAADRVSVFQLSIYLRRCGIATLGEHVAHLAKEEYFLSALKGPKRRGMLNRMTSRGVARLLPLGCTLQAIAALLTDADRKAGRAAASCLRRASVCATFRARALVYFTESLRSTDVVVQRNSCLALQCLAVSAQRPPIALAPTHSFVFVCVYLQATESVEHMVELRRCPNEDVQNAAKEAVLSFGKKGHAAFQKMEQLDLEMQEDFFQNLETEITFL